MSKTINNWVTFCYRFGAAAVTASDFLISVDLCQVVSDARGLKNPSVHTAGNHRRSLSKSVLRTRI